MTREEAMRLIRHMKEDKANPNAQKTLSRGRIILKEMQEKYKSVNTPHEPSKTD